MSSRARGIFLVRRSCTAGKVSRAETGDRRNKAILAFGIPDKMATRNAAHSPSGAVTSFRNRFERRLHVSRLSSKALATGPHLRQRCCFVVSQVPSLRRDADNTLDGTSPLFCSAGETTGFLGTPLLLCTATSRGKDDDYRDLFAKAGGEIFFWWSRFWTEGNGK